MMRMIAPITPGELLKEEFLEPLEISQYRLAQEIDVPAQRIGAIIAGKRAITADTDLRLCKFFSLSNGYWLRAQAAYDTEMAVEELEGSLANIRSWRSLEIREEKPSDFKTTSGVDWNAWLDLLPLSDLKKSGVLDKKKITDASKQQVVKNLLAFFNVTTPLEWENNYSSMKASFRRNNKYETDLGAMSSWLRLGELEANKVTVSKYSKAKFEEALDSIRDLTVLPPEEFAPSLKTYCSESGVKLILVKYIKKAHVSGVARWLDNKTPLIQLSLYGKTNDKFWFTFFHEAAHILLHSEQKKSIFLDDSDFVQYSKEEEEANEWARNILIPEEYKYDICSLKYKDEIDSFSKKINIHPGIVVGRLQYDGQIDHKSQLNKLKERFSISDDSNDMI